MATTTKPLVRRNWLDTLAARRPNTWAVTAEPEPPAKKAPAKKAPAKKAAARKRAR